MTAIHTSLLDGEAGALSVMPPLPAEASVPVPAAGDTLEDLRPFFNVSDDDFLLILGWVVQAYLPDGGFFDAVAVIVNGRTVIGTKVYRA